MTIRMLTSTTFNGGRYVGDDIYTLAAATESALVTAGHAVYTLNGGSQTDSGLAQSVSKARLPATTIAASRGLTDSDCGKVFKTSDTSNATLTVTGPIYAGWNCLVYQGASGTILFAAGASVSLQAVGAGLSTAQQYAGVTLYAISDGVIVVQGGVSA